MRDCQPLIDWADNITSGKGSINQEEYKININNIKIVPFDEMGASDLLFDDLMRIAIGSKKELSKLFFSMKNSKKGKITWKKQK